MTLHPLKRSSALDDQFPTAILDSLSEAIVVVDAGGLIQYANLSAEQFFGVGRARLVGHPLNEFVPEDTPLFSLLEQVLSTGGAVAENGVTLASPRIGNRFCALRLSPIVDSDGLVAVSLVEQTIARNIDRQMSHRSAARSVSALAAMLAHEVKNPLSGIRGAAQLLEQSVPDSERELTSLICEETDRIVALVDRMEAFADGRPIERGPINIHQVLNHVRRISQNGFGKGVRFVETYDPSLPGPHDLPSDVAVANPPGRPMTSSSTILVADDDRAIRTVLHQALGRQGHNVRSTGTAATLWQWVQEGEGQLVITDVVMPDENGLDLVPRIRKLRPDLRIIVMSAQSTLLTAVRATERGAFEYLPKPFDLNELISVVNRALSAPATLLQRNAHPPDEGERLPLIGRSPAMQEIYRALARLMSTDLTVMVTGESGAGKELVARALHDYGKRRKGPFVALNMAAMRADADQGQRAHRRGHASRPAAADPAGPVPRGLVLSPERGADPPATAARAARRHPRARQPLSAGGDRRRASGKGAFAGGDGALEAASLAGQRPRTGQPGAPAVGALLGRGDRRRDDRSGVGRRGFRHRPRTPG